MNFVEGQGVLGKIRFVDGEFPSYDRTYLFVIIRYNILIEENIHNAKERRY